MKPSRLPPSRRPRLAGRAPAGTAARRGRSTALAAIALLLAALTGCGGSTSHKPAAAPPAPVRFPAAGQSLTALRAGHPEAAVLASSVSLLDRGSNRIGFALFDPSHKLINPSAVALYTADPGGRNVRGPFLARQESLDVRPAFQSRTVAEDPSAAHSVWVADVPLTHRGHEIITGLMDIGGRLSSTTEDEFTVSPPGAAPPGVGQRAIPVHTPTLASVGGNAAAIDTRVPPAKDLQQVDFASVLGRKPVVLMFATPQLCQSRVCGPVVDVEEQVKSDVGDRAAFVHMEIYNKNQVAAGFRPQVAAYHLPTEPWTFVIDRSGRIAARFEGALSVAELEAAVRKVTGA